MSRLRLKEFLESDLIKPHAKSFSLVSDDPSIDIKKINNEELDNWYVIGISGDMTTITVSRPPDNDNKLVTLKDYKDAGVFSAMPNGFDVFDYSTDENITDKYTGLMNCEVRVIAPSPDDINVVAFYVDTTNFKSDEVTEFSDDVIGGLCN